jgi:hypothetical protein
MQLSVLQSKAIRDTRLKEPHANENGWNHVSKGNSKRRKQVTKHFSIPVRNTFSVLNEVVDKAQLKIYRNYLNVNAVKKESKLMFYTDNFGHDIPTSLSK